MKTLLLNSLVKVFDDVTPNYTELAEFSVLNNERFSFQLAIYAESEAEAEAKVSLESALADNISVFSVINIPARLKCAIDADNYFLDKTRSSYPDLLMPANDGDIKLNPGKWYSVWFTLAPSQPLEAGIYPVNITVSTSKGSIKRTLSIEVIGVSLPEQTLLHTNWFHNDCLCTHYKAEVFSEKYWKIAETFIRNAATHGVNMLLTPVFTPPLDTKIGGERPTVQLVGVTKTGRSTYEFDFTNFRRYIALCLECGIKAFEISHLFTQWGAIAAPKIVATVNGKQKKIFGWETKASGKAYTDFLRAFAPELDREVTSLGIKEKCWLHVSDEPGLNSLVSYKKAATLIHELFPGYKTFDALSDIDFYKKGLVGTPVPCNSEADVFKPVVKDFWTYYCCGQQRGYVSNRFFAMPSARNRVLGLQLYKYDAKGFLQWGHNFWYTQYSLRSVNPFKETDAGNAFPAGDAFMVYPGKKGVPLNSLRFEVFCEALQDMRAAQLLESLSSRENVVELLEKDLDEPLTMSRYPHSGEWLLNKRASINEQIKKYTKSV